MQQRLQKILAHAGIASRRAAETIILDGRVRVNGEVVTELGSRADPRRDRIEVDGQRITIEEPVYILLHKPKKVVSTMSDPEDRPTVAEYVARLPVRVYPVGRLDFQTSGALLLTNDGEFAARMLHPRHHVPKTYLVKLRGEMKAEDLIPWREGIRLEDGMTKPAEAFVVKQAPGYTWIELILREGRNQQIRRMGEAVGFPVSRLTRLSFAGISIDGLRSGQWRLLTGQELKNLKEAYGVPKRLNAATQSHNRIQTYQTADTARLRAASKNSSRRPHQLEIRAADEADDWTPSRTSARRSPRNKIGNDRGPGWGSRRGREASHRKKASDRDNPDATYRDRPRHREDAGRDHEPPRRHNGSRGPERRSERGHTPRTGRPAASRHGKPTGRGSPRRK